MICYWFISRMLQDRVNPLCSPSKYLGTWYSLLTLQACLQVFTVHRRCIFFLYSPSYSHGDSSKPASLPSFMGNAHLLAQNTKLSFFPVLTEHVPAVNILQFSCSSHWRRPEMGLSWGNTSCADVFEVPGIFFHLQADSSLGFSHAALSLRGPDSPFLHTVPNCFLNLFITSRASYCDEFHDLIMHCVSKPSFCKSCGWSCHLVLTSSCVMTPCWVKFSQHLHISYFSRLKTLSWVRAVICWTPLLTFSLVIQALLYLYSMG